MYRSEARVYIWTNAETRQDRISLQFVGFERDLEIVRHVGAMNLGRHPGT